MLVYPVLQFLTVWKISTSILVYYSGMKRQPGYFIIYHGRDALLQKMVLDHNQKMEGLQIAATQEDKCRHRLTSVQSPVDQQLRHPAPVWWIL